MTRKNAIKVMCGVVGGLMSAHGQRASGVTYEELAYLSFGDPEKTDEEIRKEWLECEKSLPKSSNGMLSVACRSESDLRYTRKLKPGTAELTINLDNWKGISVAHGKDKRFVSREELWEALGS